MSWLDGFFGQGGKRGKRENLRKKVQSHLEMAGAGEPPRERGGRTRGEAANAGTTKSFGNVELVRGSGRVMAWGMGDFPRTG